MDDGWSWCVGHGDLCYSEFRNDDRPWSTPRSAHRQRGAAMRRSNCSARPDTPTSRSTRSRGGQAPASRRSTGAGRARRTSCTRRCSRSRSATELPETGSLAGDVREMVRRIGGRADHPGRAGGAARAGRRDGRGPHAARRAARAVRRRPVARSDRSSRDGVGARGGPAGRDRRRRGRGHRRHHLHGAHHPQRQHSTTHGWSAPPP